ncbi:hypothetical protein AAVH_25081 [Aphelenchoides avenae]|nr:hypothetical protein AAVH_25081 [Aphelenchus avenae]
MRESTFFVRVASTLSKLNTDFVLNSSLGVFKDFVKDLDLSDAVERNFKIAAVTIAALLRKVSTFESAKCAVARTAISWALLVEIAVSASIGIPKSVAFEATRAVNTEVISKFAPTISSSSAFTFTIAPSEFGKSYAISTLEIVAGSSWGTKASAIIDSE